MSLKRALYLASYYGQADRLVRMASRPRGAILMFHRVVAKLGTSGFEPNRELEVTPEVLGEIIHGLRANGFEIVSLDDVPHRLEDKKSKPFACLTFDDGYRDNLELALPVCANLQAPFTVYLTTGFMEASSTIWWLDLEALVRAQSAITMTLGDQERAFATATPKEKSKAYAELSHHFERANAAEREACVQQMARRYNVDGIANTRSLMMSWEEARQLAGHPLVTIGAHSITHPTLASLTPAQSRYEIAESRAIIEERLNRKIDHFAYPYGGPSNAGDREFAICKELGFATAVTTRFGLIGDSNPPPRHALPRVTSNSFDDQRTVRVKLSGLPALLSSH